MGVSVGIGPAVSVGGAPATSVAETSVAGTGEEASAVGGTAVLVGALAASIGVSVAIDERSPPLSATAVAMSSMVNAVAVASAPVTGTTVPVAPVSATRPACAG